MEARTSNAQEVVVLKAPTCDTEALKPREATSTPADPEVQCLGFQLSVLGVAEGDGFRGFVLYVYYSFWYLVGAFAVWV